MVEADETINVQKKVCPMPVLLARRKLEQMEDGKILEVIGDYPVSKENIVRFAEQHGHKVLKITDELGGYRILIKKFG